jgi:acetate kinase
MVGVFDTAFHHQMPDYAYLYGLPYILYKRYGVRRYGFHGTSHYFVSQRAAEHLGKDMSELKMITAHLGNGCSMAAVNNGVSIDTTMGFTPLEGLLMGTRSGDVDAGAVLHVMGREELSLGEINTLLNKHSGLMGVSGVSSDMRDLIEEMQDGNERARVAFQIFAYRVKKYIGAYTAAMGGLDAVVFTGGIGENAGEVRAEALKDLGNFGIELDGDRNGEPSGEERVISSDGSRVKVFVIPTNEELVIALETKRIVEGLQES